MSAKLLLSFALAILTLATLFEIRQTRTARILDTDPVIATVDGDPVRASDVRPYLRPAPLRVGIAEVEDPRSAALGSAQRDVLFAQEAERRGLSQVGNDPHGRARSVQALISDELRRRRIPRADQIDRDLVREEYERRIEIFNPVRRCRVSAVVVRDLTLAELVLQRAATRNDTEFAELAAQHSVDESADRAGLLGWVDDESGEWLDPSIVRLALNLRRRGEMGLERAADGRYYILRALAVELDVAEFDSATEARVRNLLVEERREHALMELQRNLTALASIVVDDQRLNELETPLLAPPPGVGT